MMLHRTRKRLPLCVAFVLFAVHSIAMAAIVPVADKAVISIGGANEESFTVDGISRKNKYGTVLDFAGDATIKVTYPDGVNEGGVYFGIIATNGMVTLDLTEIAGKTFALDNGASVKGKGLLVVKGRDSLRVGSKRIINNTSYNNYAPPADVVNVEYRDFDDVAYQSPEGLILVGRVLEWELPTSTPWKLDASALPCIAQNGSRIIQSMMKDGVVALENREMWIYETGVFPATATPISVGDGSELVVILRDVKPETYFEQAGYSWHELKNPIHISKGGILNLRSHNLIVSGSITGTGTLRYTETKDGYWTKVVDASGFSGHISCELSNTTLQFGNGAFGGDVSMELCDGSAVEIGCNAANSYATTISALSGPKSGSASLSFLGTKSGTVTIASKTGNVSISGAGYGKTTVTLPSIAEGEILVVDGNENVKFLLADDFASRSDVFTLTRTNGRNVYLRSASSSLIDFLAFDVPEAEEYKLVAKNGVTYANVPENVHLTVPEGVSASVSVSFRNLSNIRMEGGTVSVVKTEPDWRSKVNFWMDPSNLATVKEKGEYQITVANDLWTKNATYPTVVYMSDAREGYESIRLEKPSTTPSTWPILVTNGVNGLHFMSMVYNGLGNRRIKLEPYGYQRPAFAIMVFGSQFGGGKAIIANEDKYFQRGGTIDSTHDRVSITNSIFANGEISTWVNGTSVNPAERGLSGGWEIISFDASGAVVHGFGYNGKVGEPLNSKGQNYGEVLLFSETPTAEERIAAEKYLAEKWGLAGNYNDTFSNPELRVVGNGTILLEDDVSISGSFAGTINLNGKSLSVQDGVLPPDDDVVVSDGRLAWFDPDIDETMSIDMKECSVDKLYDRVLGKDSVDGTPFLNSEGRRPKLLRDSSRGFGPSRNWIDYSPAHFWTGKNYGRTLRLNKMPTESKEINPISARTVFVVQDSVKSGGSAFLSELNGYSGDILSRFTKDMHPDLGAPVWRDSTSRIFSNNGATYLDGRKIDGAVEGFQGRPEILTAVGNKNFELGAFGHYYYLQDVEEYVDCGEVHGEIIVYDRVLEDSERKPIEAYLMWKWLGVARDGYSVAANMTVAGDGSLSVASPAQMPKIGGSFTGGISMKEDEFSFIIDPEGIVSGLLDMGSAAVTFPKNCTAKVGFSGGVKNGTYTLISCGSIADGTVWNLNLTASTGRKVSIVQNGGTVALEVKSPGTVITIK